MFSFFLPFPAHDTAFLQYDDRKKKKEDRLLETIGGGVTWLGWLGYKWSFKVRILLPIFIIYYYLLWLFLYGFRCRNPQKR